MAFLGSIGKALGIQNLNKGEGWNIARVVFPPILATEVAVAAIDKGVQAIEGMMSKNTPGPGVVGSGYEVYNIQGGGYGQGNYAPPPAYSVYFAEPTGGQAPWDYSTSSIPFSIPIAGGGFSETSSRRSAGDSWEDHMADSLSRL